MLVQVVLRRMLTFAEPFWNIEGSKTAPKYNLTQFSLHDIKV